MIKNNSKKFLIFQISFFLLCLGTLCDTMLFTNLNLGVFHISIETPKTVIVIYILSFFVISDFNFKSAFASFDKRFILIIIMIFLSALLSSVLSSEKERALKALFNYFTYFVCFLITLSYIYQFKNAVRYILNSFLTINLILTVSSILDFHVPAFNQMLISNFTHWDLKHSFFEMDGVKYLRPSGFVSDTNLTALSIALALLLIIINYQSFKNKTLIWGYILISGYVFGMLGSRSALIVIIVCSMLFIVFKRINFKSAIGILGVFFIIQLATPQTRVRILQIFDKNYIEQEAAIGRPLIWKGAWNAFSQNKIIGVGPGVFFVKSIGYISEVAGDKKEEFDKMEKHEVNPHNIFLTFLCEQGVIGALIFLLLLVFMFNYFRKEKKYLSLTFLTGMLIASSLSNYAPYFKYYLILCIIVYCLDKNDYKLSGEAVIKK